MKYGLLIWNVVLTLIALYLLITQLTSGKKVETTPAKSYAADSASLHAPFRIAYFEMDSVENNFQMVRDVQGEISRKEKDYNNDLAKLDYAYQTRVESYRSKGKLSNDEIEKAQIDLKQLQDQLKGQKQQLDQDYQEFVMHRQLELKAVIVDFLKEFNKTKNYSYIMVYERDQFYFKDTAYNITAEIIKGLNEQYKNKKK